MNTFEDVLLPDAVPGGPEFWRATVVSTNPLRVERVQGAMPATPENFAGPLQVGDRVFGVTVNTRPVIITRAGDVEDASSNPDVDHPYSVKRFGAVGNGTTDDRAAIQAAIDTNKVVYFPPGTYRVNNTILLRTDTKLFGLHPSLVTIKLNAATVTPDTELMRSANFTGNAHNNFVDRIHIEGLTLDADAWNPQRTKPTGSATIRGSTLLLSAVRDSVVRNVHILNGAKHCLDIAASRYQIVGSTNMDSPVAGGSNRVLIEDCVVVDPYYDDAITTHDSSDIVIRNCKTIYNNNRLPYTNDHMNGVEIDDGSHRVHVVDCQSYGFARGFQAKGHADHRPAHDVTFERCTAIDCPVGFQIWHPTDEMPGKPNHANSVYVRDCAVLNMPTSKAGYGKTHYALQVGGYRNVRVDGFRVEGGTYNDRMVYINRNAENLSFENVVIKNVTISSNPAMSGLIHFFADGGKVVSVRNVIYLREGAGTTNLPVPVVRVSSSTAFATIHQITGRVATGVAGVYVGRLENCDLGGFMIENNATPVRVGYGPYSGDWTVQEASNNRFLTVKAGVA